MKNPLSTISNLAYIIAGAFALSANPAMGVFVILLGIASTGFHWTRSRAWHHFDIAAIYFVFWVAAGQMIAGELGMAIGFVIASICHWWYNFAPTVHRSRNSTNIIGISGAFCLVAFAVQNPVLSTLHMTGWFIVALLIAKSANSYDEESAEYDRRHSLWHICTGVGIYLLIA